MLPLQIAIPCNFISKQNHKSIKKLLNILEFIGVNRSFGLDV